MHTALHAVWMVPPDAAAAAVPVVVVHGFSGSHEAMAPLVAAVGSSRGVLGVDAPGHGHTVHHPGDAPDDMGRTVARLCATLDAVVDGPVHLVGYSMGGRIALSAAVAAPGRFASLATIGASPGLADPDERRARRTADDALAERLLAEGLDWFVPHWESLPLFASQSDEVRARQRSLRHRADPAGLAASLRGIGTGAMPPLHEALGTLRLPVLVVAGALDTKFAAIARGLAADLPDGRCLLIDGAGHAAHLEQPDAVGRELVRFWDAVEAGDGRG